MANHLAGEVSRYLQQHAENPVDWYPWCEDAFGKARREDKPIFLSIGYSACHWCHVMAHESFEDEETAAILNAHFVSIKVDREERPDLDRIYMGAVQAMTGGGGWPMSVFITPEGVPFYGGTYFPKASRYNMPAFSQVLQAVADAWANRRDELLENATRLVVGLQQGADFGAAGDAVLDSTAIDQAYQALQQQFDARHGGWGSAPKFPQPMVLEFLLRYHHTTGDRQALEMVTHTLESMARGGIYDQLGGGFHRYAVDAHWLVPHFEKMLYDNAQLARVYLHAWQVMEDKSANHKSQITAGAAEDGADTDLAGLMRAVVEETLDYVMREMTSPEGGFYATQDADTEGEEGAFFVWTPDEVRGALGGPAVRFLDLYGVTESGNFEGQNILTFRGSFEERAAIAGARRRLVEIRASRVQPGRDEKILTSWNGLMLAAFAEAARAFGREDYRAVAEHNADFLLREVRSTSGRLFHVWHRGTPMVSGFLDDYTHLIEGLLALYQTTFEPRLYSAAAELAEMMVAHFSAIDGASGFYDTADDAETLILRPRELQDSAVPSGNAMAATVMQKLARLGTGDGLLQFDGELIARRSLASIGDALGKYPLAFGQWLIALDDALAQPIEVALIGEPESADVQAWLTSGLGGYAPHRLVAVGTAEPPPLLAHRRSVGGSVTAYVCRNRACLPPVTEVVQLRQQLTK